MTDWRTRFVEVAAWDGDAWWDLYSSYLDSPEWATRRLLVFDRANGICEGCGAARATQVHHETYKHVGAELLWELRAVCHACHEVLHPHLVATFQQRWAAAKE